ncbi:MAG TPA: carboxypeptidase-like regulatory domain-containing protein, partial [Thermoplasmata archaeon]|nr:carboxypeptidase-like regulatory domain-containing protein [Thermoplasmata archaeon]
TAWHGGARIVSATVKVAGAAVTANFLLPRYYWMVSGTLTNASTGARISGANVSVVSGPSSYAQSSRTNATGVYVLWLANGTYGLRISAQGSPTRFVNITVTGASVGSTVALTPLPSSGGTAGGVLSIWIRGGASLPGSLAVPRWSRP